MIYYLDNNGDAQNQGRVLRSNRERVRRFTIPVLTIPMRNEKKLRMSLDILCMSWIQSPILLRENNKR